MKTKTLQILILLGLGSAQMLPGQSVLGTAHNLSVSGPGTVKATSDSEVCVFCHTPHSSAPSKPLWNRRDPGSYYTLYSSTTVQAEPGQPAGSSILCLSCHDGTIALGDVLSRIDTITMAGGITTMPAGSTNLSTDLSDDHPISFLYTPALAVADGELVDPQTLNGPVSLEAGRVECVSCHDPHQNLLGDFLIASTRYSELCLFCHSKSGWANSSHSTSVATWNGSGADPWYHTTYTTVAENGCESCHAPHNAPGHSRLTHSAVEEDDCLGCHNGNVAVMNIEATLTRPYSHNVYSYSGVHDPSEAVSVQSRHVECVDCHNPHIANDAPASPPAAPGAIAGVSGIDPDGVVVEPIRYEYELCFRCHADSPDKPSSATPRQLEQNNTRLEFDLSNPSYHPVEGPGTNSNVPSLLPPYTESSIIYCSDCHGTDGSGGPDGPHGSIYPHILKFAYETADNTPESYQNYELCYQCHDRTTVISGGSGGSGGGGGGGGMGGGRMSSGVHNRHIIGEDTPCNVCHDPHGISSSQGDATGHSHLINFDISVVSPNRNGRLEFVDLGDNTGECYLRCHGREHRPKRY